MRTHEETPAQWGEARGFWSSTLPQAQQPTRQPRGVDSRFLGIRVLGSPRCAPKYFLPVLPGVVTKEACDGGR